MCVRGDYFHTFLNTNSRQESLQLCPNWMMSPAVQSHCWGHAFSMLWVRVLVLGTRMVVCCGSAGVQIKNSPCSNNTKHHHWWRRVVSRTAVHIRHHNSAGAGLLNTDSASYSGKFSLRLYRICQECAVELIGLATAGSCKMMTCSTNCARLGLCCLIALGFLNPLCWHSLCC